MADGTQSRPTFVDGGVTGTVTTLGANVDSLSDGDQFFGILYEPLSTSVRGKASFFRKIKGENAVEVGCRISTNVLCAQC